MSKEGNGVARAQGDPLGKALDLAANNVAVLAEGSFASCWRFQGLGFRVEALLRSQGIGFGVYVVRIHTKIVPPFSGLGS
jgi:hypothetical protein